MSLIVDRDFSVTDLTSEQIREVLTDFFRHIDDNEIPAMMFSIAEESPMEEFGTQRTKDLIDGYVAEINRWRIEDSVVAE